MIYGESSFFTLNNSAGKYWKLLIIAAFNDEVSDIY